MEPLEERVARIEERNHKVELDKKWETSWFRRLLIVALTYVVIGSFLRVIDVADPWIAAFVPVIAFVISTLTVSVVKELWLKRQK